MASGQYLTGSAARTPNNNKKTKHCDHVAGAHDRDRTGDLVLTKDVLYQLSYVSKRPLAGPATLRRAAELQNRNQTAALERVAGIEPASSAWKAEVLPLNYTRQESPLRPEVRCLTPGPVVEGVGFEPTKA